MSRARENRRAAAHQRAAARSGRLTAQQGMRPSVGKAARVSYAGSGESGYGSEWSQPGSVGGQIKPVVIDRRWSSTVSEQ